MSQSEENGLIVTREVLADMLLITPHEVNNLWKHHGMPKEARGQYDLRKVIPFYIRRKNAQVKAAEHGDLTKAEAERQLTIFNMELVRLELAEKQGVTLNADDMERLLTPAFVAAAKKLDTLVREIRSTFPKDEHADIRTSREEKLDRIIDDVRNNIANIPAGLFGAKPEKESRKKAAKRKPGKAKK